MTSTPQSLPPGPAPVVVFGFPRSGTTLLSRILDAHPEVSCPPETNLLGACGRFLRESGTDGPPLGVLSGLALAGIPPEDLLAELRRLVFALHARLAGGKPVWVEKSGFDIFYISEIERLLAGHCRFVCIIRNPLDVIASVKDLVDKTGHYMPELRDYLLRHDSPYQAFAAAWMDRATALADFTQRQSATCHTLRYEDLVADPQGVIAGLTSFIGMAPLTSEQIGAALGDPGRIGLGDWKVFDRSAIDATSIGRWRQGLPRATATRLIPQLAPYLERYGYQVPGTGREVSPSDVLRQYGIAARMRLSQRRAS